MKINDPEKIMIKCLEDSCGLTAYAETLKLREKDVSTDLEYQKNFTSYYRVRRDRQWLKKYYKFMQNHKNDANLTFEDVLRYLYSVPHKVRETEKNPTGASTAIEASFSSKILATIYPDRYPVWDSQVIRALGIKVGEGLQGEQKLQACVDAYYKLKQEIECFIASDEGQVCIRTFDAFFPNYQNVSPFKKIDFYLWNIGKMKGASFSLESSCF